MTYIDGFVSRAEYRSLIWAVCILILSECGIFLFTLFNRTGKKQSRKRSDRGTVWLVIIGWYLSLWLDFYFRNPGPAAPQFLTSRLLPYVLLYPGLVLSAAGIVLRYTAVFTLKGAFTHSVQTADGQHLIQTGLYAVIRNPAYTGSMASLMGMAGSFRESFNDRRGGISRPGRKGCVIYHRR